MDYGLCPESLGGDREVRLLGHYSDKAGTTYVCRTLKIASALSMLVGSATESGKDVEFRLTLKYPNFLVSLSILICNLSTHNVPHDSEILNVPRTSGEIP